MLKTIVVIPAKTGESEFRGTAKRGPRESCDAGFPWEGRRGPSPFSARE
jgi:hypothetical protein